MSLVMVSFFGEGLFFHEDDLEKDEIDMREIYQKIWNSFLPTSIVKKQKINIRI